MFIGKDAKNAKRDICLGIILSNVISTICFIGLSIVLSLMVPYFLLNENSPFSKAFEYNNVRWTEYIISTGILISIFTSIFAEIFVLPRVLCEMASDGLIFSYFSKINKRFGTPMNGNLITGLVAGNTLKTRFQNLNLAF